MTGFDGQDGSSCGEQLLVLDEGSGTEVGADTDLLDETGNRGHSLDRVEDGAKVELTAADGSATESRDGVLEDGGVCGLVTLDLRELLDGDRGAGETGINEILVLELVESLLVEGGLELFEDVRKLCMWTVSWGVSFGR